MIDSHYNTIVMSLLIYVSPLQLISNGQKLQTKRLILLLIKALLGVTVGQGSYIKALCRGQGNLAQPGIHRETMTTMRTGESDVERAKNFQPYKIKSFLDLHCFLCLEVVLGDLGKRVQP